MPTTPNRSYPYPLSTDAATVPAHLGALLAPIDADVQAAFDEIGAKVGLEQDGTAPAALLAEIRSEAASAASTATTGLASEVYVDGAVSGLASESYVDEAIAEAGPVGIPIFETLAEAQAWEAANPGRTALTTEAPPDPGAWQAAPPVFDTAGRTYTIPTDEGATYQVAGATKAAGTYAVGSAAVSVTVQAVAKVGYTLAGTTSWSHSWAEVPPETYAQSVLTDAPLHFVPLDDASGSATARNLGSDGRAWTPTGVTFGTASIGTLGRAGMFDRATNSTVRSPEAALLSGATAWSVEAVFRRTGGFSRAGIIGGTRASWALKMNDDSVYGYHNATFTPPGVLVAANDPVVHFAVTYNGSTVTLYRNGTSVATVAASGAVPAPAVTPAIGYTGSDANDGFTGSIAGVAVYNKALTAARVLAHAKAAGLA